MNGFSADAPRTGPRPDVAAFEQLARALVGITLKSLSALDGAVSVPQFRLLLTLDGLGRVPSSTLADALGMGASSVTRLVDRLQGAGLVERGTVEHSRSIVTVEVTSRGRDLVTAVLDRRHALLRTSWTGCGHRSASRPGRWPRCSWTWQAMQPRSR